MFCAVSRAEAQTSTPRSTSPGWSIAHCSTCMPPREPPIAPCTRVIPSWASRRWCTVTRSETVKCGNRSPYGRPVDGSIDDGPVVPLHPPSRFGLTTKKRSVSTGFPGPINVSHQPGRSGSP